MITIEPEAGVVLVTFPQALPTIIKDHDSLTHALVIKINKEDSAKEYLLGRTIYFRRYKDDARISNTHALIDITDIMGTSYENTDSNHG